MVIVLGFIMDARKSAGRPEVYTKDVFDEICSQVAVGESLRTITERNSMPTRITFYRWLRLNPELCNQYEAAKRDRADFFAEEMLGEAHRADISWPASVQKQRLIIDTMKWIASKHNPKNYGDSLNLKGNLEVKNTSPAEVWLSDVLSNIDRNKQSVVVNKKGEEDNLPMSKIYDIQLRDNISKLSNEGLSQREIAADVGISSSTVNRILKKNKEDEKQ